MYHVWGRGEVHTECWWGNLKERGHLEDPGIDNIKMDLQELGCGEDWIDLAQDRDRWRKLLNLVMKLRVS
jgi:hypothetical protein